jgi:hypothetical protein
MEEKTFNISTEPNAFALFPEGRNWLIGVLKQQEVEILFTKKDGTERKMRCTLKDEDIPAVEKKTDRTKTLNEEVLPVYDLDAQGWRSFRLDSILTVNIKL